MIDLKSKNIIVTGASGGIGNSIVDKLNKAGANILASGTRIEKLDELKENYGNIKILKFDISQSDKIEEFIENATNELGGSLDCIVNNAGITQDNLAIRMSLDEWRKVIDINLGPIGEVSNISSKTPQKLIYVKKDKKEFCFPMHEEFITNINTEKKIINVSIPEDLINLN